MAEGKSGATGEYRIGAVAKMTGIPADTLRAWERRYGAVQPQRESGAERLYTRDQVKRLTLLKLLVARGHAIGSVANLTDEELAQRLALHEEQHPKDVGPLSVVVWGDVLPLRLRRAEPLAGDIEFLDLCRSRAEFEAAVQQYRPQILVFEFPVLHERLAEDFQDLLRQSNARGAVVVYGFATRAIVEFLSSEGFVLIKGTASVSTLCNVLRQFRSEQPAAPVSIDLATLGPAPARTFTNEALAQAIGIATDVACECPHHLADIVLRLNQFEIYSAGCQNRNEADAELHGSLKTAAAHARALMETALKHAVDAEGLVLGP